MSEDKWAITASLSFTKNSTFSLIVLVLSPEEELLINIEVSFFTLSTGGFQTRVIK
jgi:hypothetical protein